MRRLAQTAVLVFAATFLMGVNEAGVAIGNHRSASLKRHWAKAA